MGVGGLRLGRGVVWLAASVVGVSAGGVAALTSAAASAAGLRVSRDKSSSPETKFQVSVEGRTFTASLPVDSVATYEWTQGGTNVDSWETASSGKKLEPNPGQSRPPIGFGASGSSLPSLEVEPTTEHQMIAGFGGAMTESAAYVIDTSPDKREIINKLFGSETTPGHEDAHFNIVRVPMGASDFNLSKATSTAGSYEETAGQFTIKSAETYTLPALEAAKRTEPELQIVAAPWSAPGWMKVSKQFVPKKCTSTSDDLRTEDHELYAHYLAAAARAYAARDLPFSVISLQNEPQAPCSTKYPTMEMTPSEEASLSTLLHIELHGLADPPQILGWDHNWDEEEKVQKAKGACASLGTQEVRASFPREIFERANDVEDVGYHSYCGWPYESTGLPDLKLKGNPNEGPGIYVTESTGDGKNETNASGNLVYEVQHEIMDPIRDGAKASLYWNLALESKDGPEQGNCKHKCRPLVTVPTTGAPTYNEDYYYWSQFSRHVQPGAVRIGSTTDAEADLDTVAFKNPNGAIVLVVLNGAQLPTEGLRTTTAISGPYGNSDMCVIVAGGRVDCWGTNYFGQLGDASTAESAVPEKVRGIADAIQVSAGDETSCAVLSSGEVTCWGDNRFGGLGDGTNMGPETCSSNPCSRMPVIVQGVSDATQVAVGRSHACAVLSTGRVDCWGLNEEYGLGDGNNEGDGQDTPSDTCGIYRCWPTPVAVSGISSATQVAVGLTNCAVLESGQVDCWGLDSDGALGNDTDDENEGFGLPVTVHGISEASEVSTGDKDACAVLSSGGVDCWGANYSGELGDGTSAGPEVCEDTEPCSKTPVSVRDIADATQVIADGATCARLAGGGVDCWGENGGAELGDGTKAGPEWCRGGPCSTTPGPVSGISDALEISGEESTSACVLVAGGKAECWGTFEDGLLGVESDVPLPLSGFE